MAKRVKEDALIENVSILENIENKYDFEIYFENNVIYNIILNYIIEMKFDIVILLLIVIFILLITFNIFNKTLERFSLGSMPSSSTTRDSQYDYLAPLPANNTWSEQTQTNFIQKFNANLLARDPSAILITTPSSIDLNYMNLASEIEANYYVENGKWPWDNYINNIINKQFVSNNEQQKEAAKKMVMIFQQYYPNRVIYKMIAPITLPQSTILSSLNPNTGAGLVLPKTNQYLTCKTATQGATQLPDGTNLIIPANGLYPFVSASKNFQTSGAYTLDYTIFESIPGLIFDGSACNICQIPNFNYFDPSNNCTFSIKTPEAYNVYSGANIKSTPAATAPPTASPSDTQSSSSSWF